eukprot:scaffold36907_cov54-Attheya_sp.AAC.1
MVARAMSPKKGGDEKLQGKNSHQPKNTGPVKDAIEILGSKSTETDKNLNALVSLLVNKQANKENRENGAFGSRLSEKYTLLKNIKEAFDMQVYNEEEYKSEREKIKKYFDGSLSANTASI